MSKKKSKFKEYLDILKEAFKAYSKENTWIWGAALSYYTLFSIAPVLLIVIAVAGMIFGQKAVEGEIYTQVSDILGPDTADQIQKMVKSAYSPGKGALNTVIGIVLLIFGATTVFYQLQNTLNRIWQVKPKPKKGFLKYLKDRFLSFTLILGIGFILLASLAVNAALTALSKYLTSLLPDYSVYLFQAIDVVLSLSIVTLLFAMIYRYLPDAVVRWRDVWVGAFFTSILFTIGRYALGIYLAQSDIGSAYGAAGSIVVLMVWVSYSAQIFFLGAEFTQAYACAKGRIIEPSEYAVKTKIIEVEQRDGESSSAFEDKMTQAEKELCGKIPKIELDDKRQKRNA